MEARRAVVWPVYMFTYTCREARDPSAPRQDEGEGGANFDLVRFHDRLLSFGAMPVKYVGPAVFSLRVIIVRGHANYWVLASLFAPVSPSASPPAAASLTTTGLVPASPTRDPRTKHGELAHRGRRILLDRGRRGRRHLIRQTHGDHALVKPRVVGIAGKHQPREKPRVVFCRGRHGGHELLIVEHNMKAAHVLPRPASVTPCAVFLPDLERRDHRRDARIAGPASITEVNLRSRGVEGQAHASGANNLNRRRTRPSRPSFPRPRRQHRLPRLGSAPENTRMLRPGAHPPAANEETARPCSERP